MDADRIALLLPEVYRRTLRPGDPLAALLEVMATLHAPVESALAGFADVADPQLTPERFVPYLARWVDVDRWLDPDGGFGPGPGRLRQVVAAAAGLAHRRGTALGLQETLTVVLGLAGIVVDDAPVDAAGVRVECHVRVVLPAAAAAHDDLVRTVVAQEKAAHVTAEIVYVEGPT